MKLGHEKALQEMMALNTIGVHLVLQSLLENGKLQFADFIRYYVLYLQQENNTKQHNLSDAYTQLAFYSVEDKTPLGKNVRRMIYETGFFKGSKFGDSLETEFKSDKL